MLKNTSGEMGMPENTQAVAMIRVVVMADGNVQLDVNCPGGLPQFNVLMGNTLIQGTKLLLEKVKPAVTAAPPGFNGMLHNGHSQPKPKGL
jgi:hypothetical protein